MLGISVALIAVAALFGIEAYKVRERLPRLVLTGFAVAFALWAALVQRIADLWPKLGAIVANIASNPMVWFVLFIALFFVLRPLWQKGASAETPPGNDGPPPGLTADDVEAIVSGQRLAALEDVEKSLAKIEERLTESDAAAAKLNADYDTFKANFDHSVDQMLAPLRAAQKEAGEDYAKFKMLVERALENTWEKLRRRCEFIDQGFAAILDRERLLDLADMIDVVGDELSGPTQGEPMSDRDAWLSKYGGWRSNVEAWARIGGIYRAGVIERVFDTPPSEYGGQWKATDDMFPNSNAVHEYKTFRIISRNFYAERAAVESCVQMAAFVHPSMKGRGGVDRDEDLFPKPFPEDSPHA
jgi:hypothetical protein